MRDFLSRHWLLLLALAAALVLAYLWNSAHRARVNAEREAEEYKLRLKGQIVAAEDTRQVLQADVEDLLRNNDLLRKAVEAAKTAAPGAKPVAAATLSTGRVQVTQAPLPPEPTPPAPAPVEIDQAACVLRAGAEVSITSNVITFATRGQNLLIAGVATLWREDPPPRTKLAEGKFTASLSDVAALAPPPEPRWGAGALGLCSLTGCSPGAVLLLPPVKVFGLRAEAGLGATLGPGATGVLGWAALRW